MTNDPQTEAFQELLLEQAKLCHIELQHSIQTLRAFEEIRPIKQRLDSTNYTNCDLLVRHVNQMVTSTTQLANAAARLRGQVIRVTAVTGEGGMRKPRFNFERKMRELGKPESE
jgi:hypothetical protein